MKKTKQILKKTEGKLKPEYPTFFQNMVDTVKEGQIIQAEFSNVQKSKSPEQLGYLHACVYPFIIARLLELGYDSLYTENFKTFTVDVKINMESVDYFFKKMFEKHSGIAEFKKRNASVEEMMEYISFIDKWVIEMLGIEIPPPTKDI